MLSHPTKDPRLLRDKPVQASMRNAIFQWLQATEFPATNIKQILNSPTAKDFRLIFEHLVHLLDPEYSFGEKKLEDEVIPVLKAFQYPFAESIDRKWLAAPASMHSWPSLLGVLHWLSELSRVRFVLLVYAPIR